jgi:hypothetical protein
MMYTMIQVHQVVVVKMYQGIGEPGYRCVHTSIQPRHSTGVVHTYYVLTYTCTYYSYENEKK